MEANLAHLKQRILLGIDTAQQRRVGELELVILSRLKRVVRLGLEVATLAAKFEVVQVGDSGNRVIKEARVVRDDYRCAVGKTSEVGLKPSDINDVQVFFRLVEQENVSF